MDSSQDPASTKSILELILTTLSRALDLQPPQAAALITSNNHLLIKTCSKGISGRYSALINWYMDLFRYGPHLASLIKLDVATNVKSKDYRQVWRTQADSADSSSKILQTLSSGCYS